MTEGRQVRAVVWDFDGVLNRNVVDGRFIWADTFEADTGHSLDGFMAAVFPEFERVMTGREDVRDRVASWCEEVGYKPGPDAILAYWFERDALPDPLVVPLMDRLADVGLRQVIATNNEARRAAYIAGEMGFGDRVEAIFSSGRIGHAKPAVRFFVHVMDALGLRSEELLLIDDSRANVAAAQALGWRTIHFTEAVRPNLAAQLPLT